MLSQEAQEGLSQSRMANGCGCCLSLRQHASHCCTQTVHVCAHLTSVPGPRWGLLPPPLPGLICLPGGDPSPVRRGFVTSGQFQQGRPPLLPSPLPRWLLSPGSKRLTERHELEDVRRVGKQDARAWAPGSKGSREKSRMREPSLGALPAPGVLLALGRPLQLLWLGRAVGGPSSRRRAVSRS